MPSRQILLRTAKGLAERLFASHGDDEERDEQERAGVSSEAGEGTSSAHGEAPASPTPTEADSAGAPSEGDRESNLAVNLQQAISMTTKPALEEMRESDLMKILTKEFSLFETTKRRPRHLQQLIDTLATVQAASVEAERAFSVCGQFVTKIRNRLSAESIDALCFLKAHFQKKKKEN